MPFVLCRLFLTLKLFKIERWRTNFILALVKLTIITGISHCGHCAKNCALDIVPMAVLIALHCNYTMVSRRHILDDKVSQIAVTWVGIAHHFQRVSYFKKWLSFVKTSRRQKRKSSSICWSFWTNEILLNLVSEWRIQIMSRLKFLVKIVECHAFLYYYFYSAFHFGKDLISSWCVNWIHCVEQYGIYVFDCWDFANYLRRVFRRGQENSKIESLNSAVFMIMLFNLSNKYSVGNLTENTNCRFTLQKVMI